MLLLTKHVVYLTCLLYLVSTKNVCSANGVSIGEIFDEGQSRGNNGNGNGNGNGNANGKVPDHVLAKFKTKHGVKANANLPLQDINNSSNNRKQVNLPDGTSITLDDDDDSLTPINIFKSTASCYEDGQQISCPTSNPTTFTKVENGYKVLISKSHNGKIRSIKARKQVSSNAQGGTGSQVYTLQAVSDDVVTYIPDEAIDDDFFSKFILKDQASGDIRRALRGKILDDPDEAAANESGEHRQLQSSSCSSFRTIELAVATDSSFCSDAGGSGAVEAVVIEIISDVSFDYEQDNLCFEVKLSHFETWCNPSADPYKPGVDLNSSGCGETGLLQFFQNYWNSNRGSVKRDIAQLFSGTGLECFSSGGCVIGCAYVNAACTSAAYGVNYVSYTNNVVGRSNLVAHEIGHVTGKFSFFMFSLT